MAGLNDTLGQLISNAIGVLQEHRTRRDHIDAGLQEPGEVAESFEEAIIDPCGVHDAVGLHGQERVGVIGGQHAKVAVKSSQATSVFASLFGVGDIDPNEVQVWVGINARQRVLANISGAPSNDFQGHDVLVSLRCWVYRSGNWKSMFGTSKPPSISSSLPVRYEPAPVAR